MIVAGLEKRVKLPDYQFDGAFGTLYAELGGSEELCECANLTDPTRVAEIHRAYLSAGADAIKTNTYQANRIVFPDPEKQRSVIVSGYRIASEMAAEMSAALSRPTPANVFADIGNVYTDPETAASAYLETVKIFCDCGAANFLFETLDDLDPVLDAVHYLREHVREATVILSFAVSEDGYTRLGRHYAALLRRALADADYAGMNCVCGPSVMLGLAARLGNEPEGFDYTRFSAMPNASYPSRQNGRMKYVNNPDYFADKLAEIAALGIGVTGGCCGTTPEHLRLAYERIGGHPPVKWTSIPPLIPEKRGNFFADFDYARKLVAVELNPPPACDGSFFFDCARHFKEAGADALTLTDSPLARVRADSLAMAAKLKRDYGLPVLPHLTCRDRNRIAVKSGLLAAGLDGVDALLAITGDSPDAGFRADGVKSVFNLSSYGLISYVASMNGEVFAASPFYIAGALNVNAPNFASELKRAEKKLSLGASMLMTQAMFTEQSLENLRLARERLDCRILAGILPLAGYKNALFLTNEVGGITIPPALCEAMREAQGDAADPDAVREVSLGFARGMIDRTWELCDGYYLMFPLKRAELAQALVRYIKNKSVLTDGERR